MEFEKFDVRNVPVVPDQLLAVTDNPRHRAILLNFKRHTLLELCGQWEEILSPEMTVPHPVYRMMENGKMRVYDGMEEVSEFYRWLTDTGVQVAPLKETMAVSDSGLYAEQTFGMAIPGAVLREQGEEIDDPDATYVVAYDQALVFPYTEDVRLIGEHMYQDPDSRQVFKLAPEDTMTPAQAREALLPHLLATPSPPFM